MKAGRFLSVGTVRGEPLRVGGRHLVPVAWSLSVAIGLPGVPAGVALRWVRPVAVEVVETAGTRRVPIPDAGTAVTVAMVAAVALQALGFGLLTRRKGEQA